MNRRANDLKLLRPTKIPPNMNAAQHDTQQGTPTIQSTTNFHKKDSR